MDSQIDREDSLIDGKHCGTQHGAQHNGTGVKTTLTDEIEIQCPAIVTADAESMDLTVSEWSSERRSSAADAAVDDNGSNDADDDVDDDDEQKTYSRHAVMAAESCPSHTDESDNNRDTVVRLVDNDDDGC